MTTFSLYRVIKKETNKLSDLRSCNQRSFVVIIQNIDQTSFAGLHLSEIIRKKIRWGAEEDLNPGQFKYKWQQKLTHQRRGCGVELQTGNGRESDQAGGRQENIQLI